jgi:hypothetical protein
VTPQSNFLVAAPIVAGHEAPLRALLATMNREPGLVDSRNSLVPFAAFETLHVARFVILNDVTLVDRPESDPFRGAAPLWLVFLGDCDGEADALLKQMATTAGAGLAPIFEHCGFKRGSDLLSWMRAHSVAAAAQYINWVGRTVSRIREEAALRAKLQQYLAGDGAALTDPPVAVRDRLLVTWRAQGPTLTAEPATPFGWWLRKAINLVAVPVIGVLLLPLVIVIAPFFLVILLRRESTDAVIAPRPEMAHVAALSGIEDKAATNPFSAFGNVKPGLFRLWTLIVIFQVLGYSLRHIYTRGRLSRVGTIHFARWAFLDDKKRLLFTSNYDSSLDSYMDDFINKVAFGLNLVFSNGIGYPRTHLLISGGASQEMEFKNYLRRHQVPTDVWYKAYPDLTAADLARNSLIREGLERASMTDAEARQWLALI